MNGRIIRGNFDYIIVKRQKDKKERSSSKEEIIEEVSIDQDKYPNLKKHKRNY